MATTTRQFYDEFLLHHPPDSDELREKIAVKQWLMKSLDERRAAKSLSMVSDILFIPHAESLVRVIGDSSRDISYKIGFVLAL